MGFKREAPTIRLIFTGDLSGLEVDVLPVGRQKATKIQKLFAQAENIESDTSPENWDAFNSLADEFESLLAGWNLEDLSGNPVACTPEGLEKQGVEFEMALIGAWIDALAKYADRLRGDLEEMDDIDPTELNMTIPPED